MLVSAMQKQAQISKPSKMLLKGLPAPCGSHIRFHEDDIAIASPAMEALKGLPSPKGSHIRFADQD
jgi:hypothetical protein